MPTYHYRCKSCKREFEEFQKMSEDPLKVCPSCNEPVLVRVIAGGTGLHFKGSGFYVTDYKNQSKSAQKRNAKKEEKPVTAPAAPAKPSGDSPAKKD